MHHHTFLIWCWGLIPGLGMCARQMLYHPALAPASQPVFFLSKNRPESSGLWGDGWTESLKLGQSQKLPILAPVFIFCFQPTLHPDLCSLLSRLLLPAPPLGSLSSGKGSQGRGLRQMQALSISVSSSWRRGARLGEDRAPVGPVRLSHEGFCPLSQKLS